MRKINVDRGKYPFPLMDGVEESNYLTWVRNHSNYMSVRGALDYVRAIGVLLRGVLLNFLVLLPYLLLASLIVAASHLFLKPEGELTLATIAGTLVFVLTFPVLTPLFKLARHKKRLATGIESTVSLRDRYERIFGALLLTVLAVLVFESLSYSLEYFHQLVYEGELGGLQFASVSALAIGLFSIADKVLLKLGGAAKHLAIFFIGIIGILLPLLVILFVADFLVFNPPQNDWSGWIFGALIALPVLVVLALVVGIATSAFSLTDITKLSLVLMVVSLSVFILYMKGTEQAKERIQEFQSQLHNSLSTLATKRQELDTDSSQTLDLEGLEVEQFFYDAVNTPGVEFKKLARYLGFAREQWQQSEFDRKYWQMNPGFIGYDENGTVITLEDLANTGSNTGIIGLNYLAAALDGLSEEQRESYSKRAIDLKRAIDSVVEKFQTDSFQTSELVDGILKVSLDDINNLTGSTKNPQSVTEVDTDTQSSSLIEKADSTAGTTQYENSNVNDAFVSTETQLRLLGERLRVAREELAVKASYSRRYPNIYRSDSAREVQWTGFTIKALFLLMFTAALWLFFRLTIDINLTSIHGLYRDRLATAFLIGADPNGKINVENDLNLGDICCHEAGSQAPYHLVNVALNLQGSKDIVIRDRKSDFFVFSKHFIGSDRTRYCRTSTMELVFPQINLATAMAISAAAASPNMGRSTNAGLVAVMTLLNIRMGYWLPNPGKLENWLWSHKGSGGKQQGYAFSDVFETELREVTRRWEQLPHPQQRQLKLDGTPSGSPTTRHGLAGIAFSGGGIRSATFNLGITQALHKIGVFAHMDYMSSVSGGGYLGSSISTLMRNKVPTHSENGGKVKIRQSDSGHKIVSVSGKNTREYQFSDYAELSVTQGSTIAAGDRLLLKQLDANEGQNSVSAVYSWRIRPESLLREVLGKLNETSKWVNVSDGGHIENLACIELLRRRCKYIIVGDGEADPRHHFNGLATLIRSARIDLGVEINIDLSALRLNDIQLCKDHWALGQISYPGDEEPGYLLYLKSSVTGDEDEVIQEYRASDTSFPHTSTADQFFTEGQFEAYRSLGQHIAEQALSLANCNAAGDSKLSFSELESWFQNLATVAQNRKQSHDTQTDPRALNPDSVV